ncbi:MAG: hypothetical protein KIB00_16900 [Paeniclostridium sordellii]|nr:hypothetical protein [Paeniclostridium sordellii]
MKLCRKCKSELNDKNLCPKCHKESGKKERSYHPSSHSKKWGATRKTVFETFPDQEADRAYCERCYDLFGTKDETEHLQVNHNISVADVNDIVEEQDEREKEIMIREMKKRAKEELDIEIEDVTDLYWVRENLSLLCSECNTFLGRKKMDFEPLMLKIEIEEKEFNI